MKRRITSIWMLIAALAGASKLTAQVQVEVVPEATEIFAHEPMSVAVEFSNPTDEEMTVVYGRSQVERFDEKRREWMVDRRQWTWCGPANAYRYSRCSMAPGGSFVFVGHLAHDENLPGKIRYRIHYSEADPTVTPLPEPARPASVVVTIKPHAVNELALGPDSALDDPVYSAYRDVMSGGFFTFCGESVEPATYLLAGCGLSARIRDRAVVTRAELWVEEGRSVRASWASVSENAEGKQKLRRALELLATVDRSQYPGPASETGFACLFLRAKAELWLGDKTAARQTYEQALTEFPGHAEKLEEELGFFLKRR